MKHALRVRTFVVYTVVIGLLLAGVWGATLLLPPTSPTNAADASREVTELYARIDSTIRPGAASRRDDHATTAPCPLEGQGLQDTLERDYHLNEGFGPDEWLDALRDEFPDSASWHITVTDIGNSDGQRVRLVGRSLLAVDMTIVGEGADQRLRLKASTRCYPSSTTGS